MYFADNPKESWSGKIETLTNKGLAIPLTSRVISDTTYFHSMHDFM